MFPKFQGHDVAMLVHSGIIVQHGEKVMSIVDHVMENIDSDERIWEILLQIGRDHFRKDPFALHFEMIQSYCTYIVRYALM